jgi:hypothetical protein
MLILILVKHAVTRLYPQVVHAVAVVSQALSLVLSLRCEMNVATIAAFFGDTEKVYQWSMMALFMDDRAEWSTFVRRGTVCAEPTRMVSFVVDNEFGVRYKADRVVVVQGVRYCKFKAVEGHRGDIIVRKSDDVKRSAKRKAADIECERGQQKLRFM